MSKRAGWALFLLLAVVFLISNRGAYHGYFQDDEIAAMSWTRFGNDMAFLKGALEPLYKYCFRAVGFYLFRVTEHSFGLDFPKYVVAIQVLHLLNVWMVWVLLRKLGAQVFPACCAVVFFALHAAIFNIVWKPAFVFDLLCTMFCLASVLCWIKGRWVLSFVCFWLAYQSKELAVMLPLVLVAYEWWFGKRQWSRLAVFLAASFSFAFQALVLFPNHSGDYSFHFNLGTLGDTVSYYSSQVFLLPLAGLVLPVAARYAGNERTWFGLTAMGLYFVPLLFLPGRIDAAYCYLPLTGLAVALAGIGETRSMKQIAIFMVFWLPLNFLYLHKKEVATLQDDRDIRAWIAGAHALAKARPDISNFAYEGMPGGYREWGLSAVFRYFLRHDVIMVPLNSNQGSKLTEAKHCAILKWDPGRHHLDVALP